MLRLAMLSVSCTDTEKTELDGGQCQVICRMATSYLVMYPGATGSIDQEGGSSVASCWYTWNSSGRTSYCDHHIKLNIIFPNHAAWSVLCLGWHPDWRNTQAV
jgi:hypothetical protein